ncbi:MAG: SDR family NAD(P)-dependent oxidoreductase [Bacteroidales bacterium]|nr:SDR family NAD(P)-dependent oxidoreductase [Bacteroidales bacterium]
MKRRLCFITGANSGIGKACAIQLARLGWRVLIGVRNRERGIAALRDIQNQSGSDWVECIEIDMSLKSSIAGACQQITDRFDTLDVLIHNAADFDIARKKPAFTTEGIETVWATNHIGPVFLTNRLSALLRKSEQGRIITVASQGLMLHPRLQVDLADPEFKQRNYIVPQAYYQSKLAQLMYTYWLAENLADTAVTVNCVRVTNVKIDISRYPNLSAFMKFLYSIKSRFSISPEQMANTYTYLASSPELNTCSGKYFNEKNMVVSSSPYSLHPKNIEAVMTLTASYMI